MSHSLNAQARDARDVRVGMRVETGLFLGLLLLFFAIRVTNLHYNTLFVDEAIYVQVGDRLWAGIPQDAMSWMHGSYLYPLLASFANSLGGQVGVRVLSALLITLAGAVVFFVARRLFNQTSAWWTLVIFGFTPISISMGQYGVYDALAVPFLAVAMYAIARAAQAPRRSENAYLAIAGFSFVGGVLSKYFLVLYLPALLLFGLLLYNARHRAKLPLFVGFLGNVLLWLSLFVITYWNDLSQLISGGYGVRGGSRLQIVSNIWREIGFVSVIALFGVYWLVRSWRGLSHWRLRSMFIVELFVLSMFAAPIYHIATGNVNAAWKHTIFSLVFLAPLAGYGVANSIELLRQRSSRSIIFHVLSLGVVLFCTSWLLNFTLDRNWGFQHSWPSAAQHVAYIQKLDSAPQRVLAEGAQIFSYYNHDTVNPKTQWQDTWFLSYKGLDGTPAMQQAIRDGWFDVVFLNDYYTPGLRATLQPVLEQSGYRLGLQTSETLSDGDIIQNDVYVRSSK